MSSSIFATTPPSPYPHMNPWHDMAAFSWCPTRLFPSMSAIRSLSIIIINHRTAPNKWRRALHVCHVEGISEICYLPSMMMFRFSEGGLGPRGLNPFVCSLLYCMVGSVAANYRLWTCSLGDWEISHSPTLLSPLHHHGDRKIQAWTQIPLPQQQRP